jgi:predicted helicase
MEKIYPDKRQNWLNEGMSADFEDFLAIGNKLSKKNTNPEAIFKIFSNGVKSNSDAYIYNFDYHKLQYIVKGMIDNYHSEHDRWIRNNMPKDVERFLNVDEKILKWIRNTKRSLFRGETAIFDETKFRKSLYRPYCEKFYFFDRMFNEDIYQFPKIFPFLKLKLKILLYGLKLEVKFQILLLPPIIYQMCFLKVDRNVFHIIPTTKTAATDRKISLPGH